MKLITRGVHPKKIKSESFGITFNWPKRANFRWWFMCEEKKLKFSKKPAASSKKNW